MAIFERRCPTCLEPFKTQVRTQKYCDICQNWMSMRLNVPKSRQCDRCHKEYWPHRFDYKLHRCYACADPKADTAVYKRCGCPNDARHKVAAGLNNSCYAVVQQSKESQLAYFERIDEIVRARVARNTKD